MNRWSLLPLLLIAVCFAAMPSTALAQEDADEKQLFAKPKKDWEWDDDKRFDFLIERLASLEASLDAVERAIAKASGKRGTKQGAARRADANNSMMDRKGGGPMKWNEFYGTTAEKFFYHPTDPNTTYHTNTTLQQMGKNEDDKVGNGVPASQSLPVHQRPPQFDYIYRANRDAKDKAEQEAIALSGQIEELNRRRTQLEDEQAELWCLLAFRAIQRQNIPKRPMLRFALVPAGTAPSDIQRFEALTAATKFLATALVVIDRAEKDQAGALIQIKHAVAPARSEFDDALINLDTLENDAASKKKKLGQFVALAQLLDDTASNLSESYEAAIDGNRFKDEARKDRFRGLLQRSLVEYAQIILALDELTTGMRKDWSITIDTKTPLGSVGTSRAMVSSSGSAPAPPRQAPPSPAASGDSPMDAIQGEWKCTFAQEGPDVMPATQLREEGRRLLVKDRTLRMERTKDGAFGFHEGTFSLEPANNFFNLTETAGHLYWIGVYDLKGDTLKLCYRCYIKGQPAPPRPQEFRGSGPKPFALYYEYQRVKPSTPSPVSGSPISLPQRSTGPSGRPLFNGTDLNGWKALTLKSTKPGSEKAWSVDAGQKVLRSNGENWVDLQSNDTFDDFTFSCEWRFLPGEAVSPNGTGIVVRSNGLNAIGYDPAGIEINLKIDKPTDDVNGRCGGLISYDTPAENHTGKTDGRVGERDLSRHLGNTRPAKLVPIGEWNTTVVECRGDRLKVMINGDVVNEAWGIPSRKGHICLRNQKSAVEFRNIAISPATQPPLGSNSTPDTSIQQVSTGNTSLDGEWLCVKDRDIDPEKVRGQDRRVVIRGTSFAMSRTYDGVRGTYEGKIEMDTSKGHFDFIGKGPKGEFNEWFGLYELSGDTLSLSYSQSTKDQKAQRPASLQDGILQIFRRVK